MSHQHQISIADAEKIMVVVTGLLQRFRTIGTPSAIIAVIVALSVIKLLSEIGPITTGHMHSSITDALTIDPEQLDIGTVWASSNFTRTIQVTNNTRHAIEIGEIRSSCNCTSITPGSFSISPRSSRPVTITLNLANQDVLNLRELSPSQFSVQLVPIEVKANYLSGMWQLNGKIRSPFVVKRSTFADALCINSLERVDDFIAELQCDPSIVGLTANSDHKLGHATITGATPYITVHFSPRSDLAPGYYTSKVDVIPTVSGSKRLPTIALPLSFRVIDDIDAIPSSLALGVRQVGTTVRTDVLLTSQSNRSFEISGVHAAQDCAITQLARPAASHQISIETQITGKGLHTRKVTFTVRDPGSRTSRTIDYLVSYYGTSPTN